LDCQIPVPTKFFRQNFLSFDSIGRIHGLIELATVQDDKPTATGIPDGMRNATSRLQPMGQMMDTWGEGVPHADLATNRQQNSN
jgi:hypothetical protein